MRSTNFATTSIPSVSSPEISEAFAEVDAIVSKFGAALAAGQVASGSSLAADDPERRAKLVQTSRRFAERDPISARTIQLYQVFILGAGIQVKAEDDEGGTVQDAIDDFLDSPRNRQLFSYRGMKASLAGEYTDGERVTALFRPGGGITLARGMDPLEISDIVTKPGDRGTVLGYIRKFRNGAHKEVKEFWPDLFADQAEVTETFGVMEDKDVILQADGGVLRFSPYGSRGVPVLTPAIDWSNAHLQFMRDRVAIQAALARFAFKQKLQGGSKAVNAAQAYHQSDLVSGTNENNPAPAAGGIFVENQGSNLESMPQQTGAAGAEKDRDTLLQQSIMGSGWPMPHYYGNDQSRFATSQDMELPAMKTVESGQRIERDYYTDLIDVALAEAGHEGAEFSIVFPEIARADVTSMVEAAEKASGVVPGLKETDAFRKHVLTALGVDDVAAALEELAELPPPPEPPALPPQIPPPNAASVTAESQRGGAFADFARAANRVREEIHASG